jgi:hypothetical protein
MSLGYVKMRRGIIEHASAGTINVAEFAILNLLILLADTATGSGTINATSLQARYFALSSNDTMQRALANLEARGYLFRLMSGSSKVASLYWINGYEATEGPNRMRRSDLSQVFVSKDITDLRWTGGAAEIPAEMSTEMPAEIPAEMSTEMPAEIPNSYKKKEERRKKKETKPFFVYFQKRRERKISSSQIPKIPFHDNILTWSGYRPLPP